MNACPVCGTPRREPFLVRTRVPVHQNLIVRDAETARGLGRGTLELHACDACGFVCNAAFDPALLSYGAAYDNTQSCSPAFGRYVDELAAALVDERGVRGSRIVEIGCGKGTFLQALVRRDPGNTGVGFDPSYAGPLTAEDGRLRFERRFYDERCTVDADVVVSRHVIEHIPDPVHLLRNVRAALGGRPARLFFETPCVEWILEREVIWDFFYEHCSYFTARSLSAAFERAGCAVDVVRHTFGDQYLWAEARAGGPSLETRLDPGRVPALARAFASREQQHVSALRHQVEAFAGTGPVALWGAAAKGVTLANLIDPDCRLIACVVDLNPNKQGGYLPGSGHPIVAPHQLPAWGVQTALLTNPNYLEENTRLLQDAGLEVRLVNLMDVDEADARRH